MGLGIINASFCMDRSMELACGHGIGLVAIRNTNHWLRAASYALQACGGGLASMCFSSIIPDMPAWCAGDPRTGNNPLTPGFPFEGGDIIVDMAMSQFSAARRKRSDRKGGSRRYIPVLIQTGADQRPE